MEKTLLKTILMLLVSACMAPAIFADELPTVPGTPQGFKSTFTKITFMWTESTDDVAVSAYKIYRGGTEIATTTELFYTDTGLGADTQYTYTVKAIDSANQLSDPSPELVIKTLAELDCDNAQDVMNVVDGVTAEGLTASALITEVQNAFSALGYDSTFDKVNPTILTEMVQQRIDQLNETTEEETPASRAADQAELDQLLLDHFNGNSFLTMYTNANLTELAEKHFQNGESDSALVIYDYSLNYLSDVETSVGNTLHRMSYIKLKAITEETEMQAKIDILHDSKNTLMRFFDFFPNSTSHIAQNIYIRATFNYFWRFPELLEYHNYNQDVFDAALTMIQNAKNMDDSAMNAIRLDRISSWELTDTTVAIQTPSGTPITGEITATNISDSSRYPEDPIYDVRSFMATAASTLTPLYLGHNYDFQVKADVDGGNPWVWSLGNMPHEKGKIYTYDHGVGPTVTDLADTNAPAQIVVISSQPTAPYNLSATRFIETFTLSWDWVSPQGFDFKEFKVFRSGTEIGTVTANTMPNIPLDAGNNTFTYTVIAYDQNNTPSSTSSEIVVTPDFTEEQEAYFQWKQEHFGTDPMYDYQDPDGDGLANYYEFLLGSDPNLAPVTDVKATITDAVSGLKAEYNNIGSTIYSLPNFDSLTPASSEVITNFAFNANSGNILGSGVADYVAVRLQGYIDVPADGKYRFYLNSDDGSELYIDGERIIDNDGRHTAREYSGDVYMRTGVHAIEIWYFENTGSGTLEVDWTGPGVSRTALDSTNCWYTPNPTNLLAESLAQNRDSDNDGIIDMIEYQLGTNVNNADSDGDGISDLDEINITNTDPLNEDTDGDSFSDFDEVFLLFSDPNVADIENTITEVANVSGGNCRIEDGLWLKNSDSIYSFEKNGAVKYTIDVPAAGVYRLEVEITENSPFSNNSQFTLALAVDGNFVGKTMATAPYGTNNSGYFYLTKLTAGEHEFKIIWENVKAKTNLQINALKLQALGGPDNDSNGIPDWIDNRLEQMTQVTVPATSPTSPVCIEGENQLNIGTLGISGYYTAPGDAPVEPELKPAPANTWYSNIDLSPTTATVLTFDFQNGTETIPKTVTWTETNAMLADDTMIRVNDALLLAGFPDGAVTGTSLIEVDGEQFTINYDSQNDRNSITYKFENPGEYTVSVTYTPDGGNPVLGSMNVKVVSSYFASPPVGILNQTRSWINPNITAETVIAADSYINMFETEIQPSGRDLDFQITEDRKGFVVGRLGEDGPIMDSEEIQVMDIEFLPEYRVYVVENFEDGSVMVENFISLAHIPDDLAIKLRIFVGGHTFDDGTIERWVYASDFDEYGVYRYQIIRADEATTGVCHRIEIYQDDVLLKNY